MAQISTMHARHPENSTSKSFSHYNKLPTIIDKKQAKHLYHLERVPNVNTSLYLDSSDTGDNTSSSFESSIRKQVNGNSFQPIRPVDQRSLEMPYKSMENISQEKTGFDAYRVFTNNIATLQSYPYVHQSDQGYNTDRSKSNKTFHYSRGYGGVLLCDEYDSQSEMLFSNQNYTSYQQTTNNQSTRDSKAPTYEPYTSDPFLKSHSCTSFYDTRSPDIINWDRTQRRNLEYYRKPLDNVPSAFRTRQHTSNYTDTSDTYKMQNLNPVLRSKEPKYATHLPKTRNSRWIKTNPIPDDDQSDDTYITTTADVYKILPIDYSSPRHTNIHGIFSKSISNIMPYNPYHPAHYCSETVNGSLDSRPHLILQQLPRIKLPPKPVIRNNSKPASTIENETEKPKA